MIRKLLYRFRRMVLVWRFHRLQFMAGATYDRYKVWVESGQYSDYRRLFEKMRSIKLQLAKLDATEMSKGEAHVVVR